MQHFHHADLNDISLNNWIDRWLPYRWRPYIRLCRLDRPIGIWLTLLPCLAALVQASHGHPVWTRIAVFTLGAVLMRGLGCTVNDIFDRNIDAQVQRTRLRPLASRQISLSAALWFLLAQLVACVCLLFFINPLSRWLALALMPIVGIYPLCKRFTNWPQAVLGICFNWGMLMAWSDTSNTITMAAIVMWAGAVVWQIGYDTLYAYVDRQEDQQLKLHSTALLFGRAGKIWIASFYIATVLLWTWGGYCLNVTWIYYTAMLVIAIHFTWQIIQFDIQHPAQNFKLFRANVWVGGLLFIASFF